MEVISLPLKCVRY